jgi:hypothetical protein
MPHPLPTPLPISNLAKAQQSIPSGSTGVVGQARLTGPASRGTMQPATGAVNESSGNGAAYGGYNGGSANYQRPQPYVTGRQDGGTVGPPISTYNPNVPNPPSGTWYENWAIAALNWAINLLNQAPDLDHDLQCNLESARKTYGGTPRSDDCLADPSFNPPADPKQHQRSNIRPVADDCRLRVGYVLIPALAHTFGPCRNGFEIDVHETRVNQGFAQDQIHYAIST